MDKYKEAIERLKQWDKEHPNGGYSIQERDEFIFPELAEPEDESIRKALLEMVHDTTGDSLWVDYGVHKEDAIAWLEKQGEPTDIPADAVLDSNEDGLIADTIQSKPKFKVGDKIYLKPEYRMPKDDTPIANTVFEIRRIDDKYYRFDRSYIFIEDQDKYELVEQKSAWSEEDEYLLDETIKHLEALIRITKKQGCAYSDEIQYYQRDIDRLKSFKERYTWKPSERQLDVLKSAINELDAYDDSLTELYNDLKKLKD